MSGFFYLSERINVERLDNNEQLRDLCDADEECEYASYISNVNDGSYIQKYNVNCIDNDIKYNSADTPQSILNLVSNDSVISYNKQLNNLMTDSKLVNLIRTLCLPTNTDGTCPIQNPGCNYIFAKISLKEQQN